MFETDDQVRVFGVTDVENLFFTEYLPAAEGDFIKVYLMCLYHAQLHDAAYGLKEMAAELSMDESRVEAALRYWERRRVLTRVQSDPPRYQLHHLGQRLLTGQDGISGDRAFVLFSEAVYALFGDRRKIRPNEIATGYEWVQELGLPQHVVLLLLSHCIAVRGIGFTFKAAEKLAIELKEAGIETEEDAEKYLNQSKDIRFGAQKVLRRFGLRRSPTDDELKLYKAWMEAYGFTHDDIQDACAETVKASNPTFAYLDGVLSRLAAQSKRRAPVRQQLESEQEKLSMVKEALDILGLRVSPVAVKAAYEELLKQYPQGEILLAAGAVQRKRGKFEDLPVCLAAWHKKGLDSEEKIRAFLNKRDHLLPLAKTILENAGQEGAATDADIAFVEKWLQNSPQALIEYAAVQARSARQKMPYIDKVLAAWRAKGITTPKEAEKLGAEASSPARAVNAQQYAQREYTEEELARGANALIEEVRSKREP